MKVLHLDTGHEWRVGQQQLFYLTQGLEEQGLVSVVAASQGSPLALRLRRENLPLIELPSSWHVSPRAVRALQKILADRTWDVLHAHTAHAHTLGFLAFRLPPSRPFHRPAFLISRRVDSAPARDPLTRLKYTSADQCYICVSHAVASVLKAYGVNPSFLRVVHSGISLSSSSESPESAVDAAESEPGRSALRAELHVSDGALLIGNFSPLVEEKGHRYLLEAMPRVLQEVPDAHLVLIGSGELEKELARLALRLSVERAVSIISDRADASRYLPALDLYVLSSIAEGLGTSLLEAAAAGLAVVGTTAGGIPEAVEDGATGLLVRPADPAAMAEAMVTLLQDRSLRLRMGRNARNSIAERFSTIRMVEETMAIYLSVLARV